MSIWERFDPPMPLSTHLPYLDWALLRPKSSQGKTLSYINNIVFPRSRNKVQAVTLYAFERSPSSHLSEAYIVSGVRGIVYRKIITASSFIPSLLPEQESCEAWTVILEKNHGE